MNTASVVSDTSRATDELPKGSWLLLLIPAIAWLAFGFIVLSFSHRTVTAVAILAGVLLLAFGVFDLVIAVIDPFWRIWHGVLGVVAIGAGITAFVYQDETFHVLAVLLAWYLFFRGTFDIVRSLALRRQLDLWGLTLLVGVFELGVGLWALSYPGHAHVVLTLWVAMIAISRSIICFVLAFAMREALRRP